MLVLLSSVLLDTKMRTALNYYNWLLARPDQLGVCTACMLDLCPYVLGKYARGQGDLNLNVGLFIPLNRVST